MLMEENKYNSINEDSEFQDLKNLLQELPKVKADDNFEFNLITKIQNGNFDAGKYKENKIGFSWIYAPATALVLSMVLIFFVFNPDSEELDNPLMANPRAITASNIPDTMIANTLNKLEADVAGNQAAVARKSAAVKSSKKDKDSYVVVFQPNDVIVKEKAPYPFEQGVDLDNYVGRNGLQGQGGSQLAGYGNNYFDFDGFFVRVYPNKKQMMLEKARLDSLKNLQKMQENK